MFNTSLSNVLSILTQPHENPTFDSIHPEKNPFNYRQTYQAAGLRQSPQNNTPTLLELEYQDNQKLEQTLQTKTPQIVNFFIPIIEKSTPSLSLVIQSIWNILQQKNFTFFICYYPENDAISLDIPDAASTTTPLVIFIHDTLFKKVYYSLLQYIHQHQKESLTKLPPEHASFTVNKLIRFQLERYKILQLPIYTTLHNIKNQTNDAALEQSIVFIENKLAELNYFFHLSTYALYRKLSYTFSNVLWQSRFMNTLMRGLLFCHTSFLPKLGRLYHHPGKPIPIATTSKISIKKEIAPRISIVTPSFNQGQYIERTIKSVLEQNYPNLDYVIQDGLSSDNTVEIITQYQDKLKHWASVKDHGQSQAINLGFAHCQGDIMAYLNSDDLLLPNTLHYVADYFMRHPDVDVVYGHRILIDENDMDIGRWVLPRHSDTILSWADYIPQETLFWRRRIWDKVGGKIDEEFKFAMDWDLILRFREVGAKFKRLPKFLGAFRVHPNQKTSALVNEVGLKEMDKLRCRTLGYTPNYKQIRKHIAPYLLRHIVYHKLYRTNLVDYD